MNDLENAINRLAELGVAASEMGTFEHDGRTFYWNRTHQKIAVIPGNDPDHVRLSTLDSFVSMFRTEDEAARTPERPDSS